MRRSPWLSAAVLAVTGALVLTACGGGSNNSGSGGSGSDATVSVYGTEPQHPLIPSNIKDLGGFKAIQPLFANLVEYRSDTAKPFNLMADSITTTDAKVYDIKIKKDWKFH